jgi:hypothetical protein
MKTLMYLAMTAQLLFPATALRGQIEIRRVSSVKIESSWSSLTDTCEIHLPLNVPDFNNGVRELLHRGDPVTISVGYNGNEKEEFTGYIAEVSAGIPVIIRCEDEMFKLKSIKVNRSYQSVGLQQLVKDIAPGYETDVMDLHLGAVRLEKTTVAEVLQLLKNKQIHSYFKGKVLVVGKTYTDDTNMPVVKFAWGINMVNYDNLKFHVADDLKIKCVAVSYLPGGKTLEATVGDLDGNESRIAHYNITDKAKLKKLAQTDLDKLKVDGFTGSFTAFGIPVIRHGQKAEIYNDQFPDRTGTYYCDATVLTYSESGYLHREVTIGRRAS